MVQAVRCGASMRQVADQFGVALATVQRWVARAAGQRLDRVDWTDRPCGLPTPVNRTQRALEDRVLTIRQELRDTSDLGEFGAAAIHREWLARGLPAPPSVRTIGLILERRGALDRRRRTRRPPPPPGWYLPPSPTDVPSWTASTSSRGWSSAAASTSRSSTASPCTAAWSCRGRTRPLPPISWWAPWSSTGGPPACLAMPSSTTTRSSRGRRSTPIRSAG